MKEVTITELARGLSEFVNRANYRGEEFLIMRGGKPVATLAPVPAGVRIRDLAQTFSALPHPLPGDLEAFEADLAAVRRENNEPIADRWP